MSGVHMSTRTTRPVQIQYVMGFGEGFAPFSDSSDFRDDLKELAGPYAKLYRHWWVRGGGGPTCVVFARA